MAARSHHHQPSVKSIIDSSGPPIIFENEQQRVRAIARFHRIVGYFEATEKAASKYGEEYNRPALVRLTFEYALSSESQDKFLKTFFESLAIEMFDDNNEHVNEFREPLFGFADHLIDCFFVPCMSSISVSNLCPFF